MIQGIAHRLPQYLEFLDRLNFEVRHLFRKQRNVPKEAINWFDIETASMIGTIIHQCTEKKSEEIVLSVYQLAEMSHVSYQSARTRLTRMAAFGIIETESDWEQVGKRRKPTTIRLHRHFRTAVSKGSKPGLLMEAVRFFALTGFRNLTEETAHDAELGRFGDLAEKVENDKAEKTKNRIYWAEKSERFVKGAARIWQVMQSARGYGSALPNWCGENLSPTTARERRELEKIFQQYGGRITATAWWVFCGGIVQKDDKGNRIYNPEIPHIQFASIDRKPSQFTKHFNAILCDEGFKRFATTGFTDELQAMYKRVFGDSFEILPRDGRSEFDLLGFYFGQTSPTVDEVPA
jgi:hypothetical protein